MVNIVMIAKGRDRLTKQALDSVIWNSTDYNLTLVSDSLRGPPWIDRSQGEIIGFPDKFSEIRTHSGILGQLRNLGAYWSEKKFGRGEWLCFLDNDVAVFPGWIKTMAIAHRGSMYGVIGGCRHPFHKVFSVNDGLFGVADAVAGYSMFMNWHTWNLCGPFDANAPGIGQSEDFALCQRVKAAGGIVGYVDPPVLSHCGITNSDGKPAVGADQFPRVPGLLYL